MKVVTFEQVSRTDKNTRILMLYDALLNGNSIDKKTYSMEHGINERTFDRDIEDVRLFLSESFSCEELKFDRESNTYRLSGSRPKYIDRMEATVILKVLLESELFRKDEMRGLLDTVISSVTQRDAEAIQKYISSDLERYQSNTDSAILKIVEDLYVILNSGNDICVTVNDEKGCNKYNISPLEIFCENREFVLVAAQNFKLNTIVKIKINNIVRFEKLLSNCGVPLKKEYYKIKEK